MKPTTSFFNEQHLRYIQRTLNASRQEVIATIRHSHISAQKIADCIKRLKRKCSAGVPAFNNPRPRIV